MAAAELACRTAKERGRNRVEVFYGGEQSSARIARLGFAAQVGAALAPILSSFWRSRSCP